ncbi:MAG TPA: MtnX-like HAD-IB family phosphatase [Thermodesulfobacteriota bacterium]|nr:MtnX-like HAD-IB family phosphatase [Thermodesulfobacteriota bacterium]
MKRLVLCDFDGTICLRDMGYVLINRFTSGNWEAIDRDFRKGKIGSKEAYSRIAKILSGDEPAILRFVQEHSDIDPHFPIFYQFCRENGIDIKIASDGLDFYIKKVLEIHHLSDISFYANLTHFRDREAIDISFPHSEEECGLCGTCKKKLIQLHRKEYDSIFFVGNGLSDRCAAQEADFVFAKDSLYPYCVDQDITCHFFKDFHEILADFKKEIRGIIFDLDGTLIESYEAIYLGLKECLQYFGKDIFPFSDLKTYLRADLEATLSQFFSPAEILKAIPIMRKKYEEVYLDKTHFLNGAKEALTALHSNDVLLGIASNKFGRFSRGVLMHLGVSDYFKSVIGAGDVARNKPFPDMIQTSLKEMNLSAENSIFVGDTLTDIESGKQAGVDVYALPTGFFSKKELSQLEPRRILRNLEELVRVAKNPLSYT